MATVRFKRTTSDKLRVYYDELKFNDTPYRYTTLTLVGNLLTVHNNIDPNVIDFTVDWADVTFPVTASAIDLQKTIQGWINEGTKEVRNISDFIIEIDDAPEQLPCDNRLYSINGDLWWNCQLVAISGGGGNPVCIQSGTTDGQILVWDNTLQCWELGTLSSACVQLGTQEGNTLYWNAVDACWNETETIRHVDLGVMTVSNATDKNVVLISENGSTIGVTAKNSVIQGSINSSLDAVNSSLTNADTCAITGGLLSSVSEAYNSYIDQTNNPTASFNSVENSVFCDITDTWNLNSVNNSVGSRITGFGATPDTGTARGIWLGLGVDPNDLVNGRRVRIEGRGQAQSIIASGVRIANVNSDLTITSSKSFQSIINCEVNLDNTFAGIFDGHSITLIGCENPVFNANTQHNAMIAMPSTTITDAQDFTIHFPTERSVGGKQYRVDELAVSTALTYEHYHIVADTTLALTFTLPAAPIDGQDYVVVDGTGNAGTNNITLDGGTKTILSPTTQATTYVIDGDYCGATLIYSLDDDAWHLTSSIVNTGAFSTTCVNVGTVEGQTLYWDLGLVCWNPNDSLQKHDGGTTYTNSNGDKDPYFISSKSITINPNVLNSAVISSQGGQLSNAGSTSHYNTIIGCDNANVGAAFGVDGNYNTAIGCVFPNISGSNYINFRSNNSSNIHLCTRFEIGYGVSLNAQGCTNGLLCGVNNTTTNATDTLNIGGRNQLINHNPTAGKDNTIINSPHTALNSSAVIDFTNILTYMDDERTATNYTDNISVGGGGNIVKGGAGGAFGNGFFNSFANYVDTPVTTFAPGQIFGVNCFINSQECQLANAFGDTAFCTFINCWQSGIINGSVANPFIANNTIIGGGVGVGASGSIWINGGTITDGGGVSIYGSGSQNTSNQCIQIGARGVSNIDSSQRGIQIGVDSSYINNGSSACGQFTASNCLTDNSERSGSMFVALAGIGSNLGMVRVIDSLASSHCNIFTDSTTTYVDLTDCEASGIRDCKFVGTLGEPNYLPAGGSWGLVNATTKSAQSMIACYNTTAEVGNNCVVMTQYGTNFTDTQDNKLHVATTRHTGGEQRKVSVYTTGTNLLTYEEHIIVADDCTVQLPTTPIDGQEYYVRHFDSTIGNDVVVDGNGINIRVGNTNSATDTLVGGTDTTVHLVYSSVKNLWIEINRA